MATVAGLQSMVNLPFPIRGLPYGIVFPIFDADGDLVTGAASLDSEVSKDGDTFADCTNEATEIATSSGMYYLLITAAEMGAQVVTGIVKTSTSGAKTTPFVLYPRAPIQVRSATAQAGAAGTLTLDSSAEAGDDYYNNMVLYLDGGTGSGQVRMITDYVGSTKVASVTPNWTTTPDNTSTFKVYTLEGPQIQQANVTRWNGGSVASPNVAGVPKVDLTHILGAAVSTTTAQIGANMVQISGDATAADNLEAATDGTGYNVGNSAIIAASVTGNVSGNVSGNVAGSVGSVTGNVGGNVSGNVSGSVGSVATGGITAGSIATGAIDADALAADAIDEIWDEVLEGGYTGRQVMRVLVAALAGIANGGGTATINFRDLANTKNRITLTVDANGNRSAVVLDAS